MALTVPDVTTGEAENRGAKPVLSTRCKFQKWAHLLLEMVAFRIYVATPQ